MEIPKTPETLDEDAVVTGSCQAQNPFYRTQEEAIDLASKGFGDFDSYCTDLGVSNVELLNHYIDKEKGIEFVDFNTEEIQLKSEENVDVWVPKGGSKVNQDAEVVVEKSSVEGSGNGISLFVEVFGPPNGLVNVDKPAVLAKQISMRSSNDLYEGNGGDPSAEISDIHCPILSVLQNGTIGCDTNGVNEAEEECKFFVGDLVWFKTKTQSWWPGLISDPLCPPKDATKSDQSASLLVKSFGKGSVWCSPLQLMPFVDSFEEMLGQGNSTSFNGAVMKAVNEFSRRVKSQMTCSCILKAKNETIINALSDGDNRSKDSKMEMKMSRIGADFVNLFEPKNFVSIVKFLALDISMPGMLEFEATRNCLYAFYRALGHRQMPMHQLAKKDEDVGKVSEVEMDTGLAKCTSGFSEEGNENSKVKNGTSKLAGVHNCQLASPAGTGNTICTTANDRWSGSKSEKVYESRERRRSRYLLPPYTDLSFGTKKLSVSEETETDGKTVKKVDGQSTVSSSLVKSTGRKLQKKKKSTKAISERDASGIPGGMHFSSAGMLSELRSAALDCLMSNENRRSDEVELFFCKFRRLVFLGKSGSEIDINVLQTIPGVEFPMDKEGEMVGDPSESGEKKPFSCSMGKNTQKRSRAPSKITYRRRRKKEMATTGLNTIPPGFSDVNGNPANGSFMINFRETDGFAPEAMPVLKKRRQGAAINMELQQAKVTDVLPDLNGSCTTPGALVEDLQENISFPHELESKTKNSGETASAKTHIFVVDANANNTKVGSLLKDVQVMCPLVEDLQENISFTDKLESKTKNSDQTASAKTHIFVVDANANNTNVGSLLKDVEVMCPLVEDSQENISFADKLESKTKNSDETASAKTHICVVVDANASNTNVGPLLKDVHVMCPCSTHDIAEMKTASASLNSNSNSEFTANQTEANVNNVYQTSSFVKDLLGPLSPVGKPGPQKMKRKEKAPVDPIPDLNGNAADPISSWDNLPDGESKPPRKRRRRNKPIAGFTREININYNKVQTYGEAFGSVLLLTFSRGFPLPSKETLIATFCGFGRIKESETQTLTHSISAQVVFENSSDARNALKSLEKNSPFGPALIAYRLQHFPAVSRVLGVTKTMEGFKFPAKKPYGLKPNSEERPNLSVMRKNLEMMTLMLEKAGHDISPEIRSKLETEVKGLLKKVSTMVGSSSSTTSEFKL